MLRTPRMWQPPLSQLFPNAIEIVDLRPEKGLLGDAGDVRLVVVPGFRQRMLRQCLLPPPASHHGRSTTLRLVGRPWLLAGGRCALTWGRRGSCTRARRAPGG